MSKGRLTRQELGWLLTQEAQGAAERLRVGVQVLKTQAPPPPDAAPDSGLGLDATLDALDDAMKMLSSLHKTPSIGARVRRGRIDLAALIWEVAPDARVSIEPGAGTEVFGDEGELRRMLHVLVGHGTGAGSQVTIRRAGDDVRVSVVLGPDSSVIAETERAWVSRMAIRYGGRYDLEGGAEVLSFPGDNAAEQRETEVLRRELDEARKQGEAYARELAQAFAEEEKVVTAPSTMPPPSIAAGGPIERFSALGRFAGGVAAELRSMLSTASRQVPPRGSASSPSLTAAVETEGERWEAVRRALGRAQDFVGALANLGELDPGELAVDVDLLEVARTQVATFSARADRSGISLRVEGDAPVHTRAAARGVGALLREIIGQALAASPRDAQVIVRVTTADHGGGRVEIDDAGPPLPLSARRAFLALEIEPGTYGRPTSVPLYIAAQIMAWQRGTLELSDSEIGGLRVSAVFPPDRER